MWKGLPETSPQLRSDAWLPKGCWLSFEQNGKLSDSFPCQREVDRASFDCNWVDLTTA
jgi:hypothetical protein